METLIDYFIEYGYLIILLGTLIEGEVVLIVGGFLVYVGYLDFAPIVLIATVAAMSGDNFFFWLGRRRRAGVGHPWAASSLRFIGKRRLFKGEEFMRRHGGKSIFFVHFLYGLRFAGAMTAGYLGMGLGRFFFFNLIGSLTWVVVLTGAGYLFGQSLDLVTQGVRLAQIGLLLLIVLGLIGIYLLNSRRKRKAEKELS